MVRFLHVQNLNLQNEKLAVSYLSDRLYGR